MALKDEAWRLDPAAYPHAGRLDSRYGDMDANAHLNNVALARLIEEARVRFHTALRAAGSRADGGAIMIAHVAIDYVGQGRYPLPVETGVAVVAIGQRSYRLAVGLFQEGRAIALADSVMVTHEDGRAVPVGPALAAALARYRAPA